MRRLSLCAAAAAAALASCQMPSLPRPSAFEAGAWRTGVSFSVADNSTQGDLDVSADRLSFDLGKILGPTGEFGARLAFGTVDETDADTGSIGAYGRYWFPHDWMVRPWAELSMAFAGLDFGTGDESGWEYGAGLGATWWFLTGLGLDASVREIFGNYETDEIRSTEFAVGVSVLW